MNALQRLAYRAFTPALGNAAPTGGSGGGGVSAATQNVTWQTPGQPQTEAWDGRAAIENAYYQSVWVMRPIQALADTVASLPFVAGMNPENPGTTNPNAQLARLLGQASPQAPGGPNPTTSSRAFWAWSVAQRAATGKMAWELQRAPDKSIIALWPLVSYLLKAVPTAGGSKGWFDHFLYDLPTGLKPLKSDNVFYSWRPSQRDWRQAESLLEAAALPISVSRAIDRHMYNLLKNGMVASHIVTSLPIDESDQRRAFEAKFQAQFSGFDNAGKQIFNYVDPDPGEKLTDVGIQVVPIATTPIDGGLEWLAGWSKDAILVAIGVPESLIGNASQRIYANSDAEYRNFWTTRALGVVTELQDDVNVNLSPQLGDEVGWFDLSRVVALQPPSAFAPPALTDMINAGVITIPDAQNVLGVNASGAVDTDTAPIGEEAANSSAPAGGAGRTLTWESRTVRGIDGRQVLALPDGWRCERIRANTHTIANETAWQWKLIPAPRQRIVVAESRSLPAPDPEVLGRAEELHTRVAAIKEVRRRLELRTPRTGEASTVPEPFGSPSGPGLWHHKGWELPPYIQHVAHELQKSGKSESEAISMAVGIVRNWAEGHDGHGGKVHADVQAAAAKNIAKWEALKAAASSSKRDDEGDRSSEDGHPFYGNQYVIDVTGLKPDGRTDAAKKIFAALGKPDHQPAKRISAANRPKVQKAPKVPVPQTNYDVWKQQQPDWDKVANTASALRRNAEARRQQAAKAKTPSAREEHLMWADTYDKSAATLEAKIAAAQRGMGALTESSSAGDLLPVAPMPVGPKVDEAQLLPHRFETDLTDAKKCAVCGRSIRAAVHRREKRHAGPAHVHVPTGHANTPARARLAAKSQHKAAMISLEGDLQSSTAQLFDKQQDSTLARLNGKRGRQMTARAKLILDIRAEPDDTTAGSEQPPPVDPTAIFDAGYWAQQTAQHLYDGYQPAAIAAKATVRLQLGPDVTGDADTHAATAVDNALRQRANQVGNEITQTTLKQLTGTLSEGVQQGESTSQLADRVKAVFHEASTSRAQMIARTEANAASNMAQNTYASSLPLGVVAGREWLAVDDARTRPTHRLADGQTQPMGVPFQVGGFPMDHPGDPAAPPDLTVNCRCTTAFIPQSQSHLLFQRPANAA